MKSDVEIVEQFKTWAESIEHVSTMMQTQAESTEEFTRLFALAIEDSRVALHKLCGDMPGGPLSLMTLYFATFHGTAVCKSLDEETAELVRSLFALLYQIGTSLGGQVIIEKPCGGGDAAPGASAAAVDDAALDLSNLLMVRGGQA